MTRLPALIPVLLLVACGSGIPEPVGGPTGATKTIEGLLFVEISPGQFTMRAAVPGPQRMVRWPENSMPAHLVTIGAPIWVATTEVSNDLFSRFKSDHVPPAESAGPLAPAVGMSHAQAQAFCAWLTEKHPGTFRLPSEAEWEYLCRAGSNDVYCFGDDEALLPKYAWFADNAEGRTHPVGTRQASPWGLFDFHGNVLEWCADTWHGTYEGAPADGSAWIDETSTRTVIRGGSFENPASYCRAGLRTAERGGDRTPDFLVGIRVVATFDE